MSQRQGELIRVVVYLTFAVVYLAVCVAVAFPELRQRSERGVQWARYYHWLGTRLPVPGWVGALERDDLPDEVPL